MRFFLGEGSKKGRKKQNTKGINMRGKWKRGKEKN